MSTTLWEMLCAKDKTREYKKEYTQKTEVKRKRMEKINEQIKRGIEENKKAAEEGKDYKSGIAIQAKKAAQKTVKDAMDVERKKNKALPPQERVCKFYPKYCQRKGHVDARNRACGMFGTTKEEKDAAMKAIENDMVVTEAERVAEMIKGRFLLLVCTVAVMNSICTFSVLFTYKMTESNSLYMFWYYCRKFGCM